MKLRNFNMIASMTAFAIGTIYLFSDTAGITANVIGASGSEAGLVSIIGIFMILGSMALFIVSMNSHDHMDIGLERLVRRTKFHTDLSGESDRDEELYSKEKK